MVSLNKIVRAFTHEGARGKRFTPEKALKRALMNCLLWEDQFYEDGVAIADRIRQLVPTVAPARVAELLDQHKDTLWGELSYRSGIIGGDGKLTSDWRSLFERHSDRFLLGSDTWINERWFGYDTIFKEYRGWLAQLPPEQARRIATDNALRLFDTVARN